MGINLFSENNEAMVELTVPRPEKVILEQVCEDLTKILNVPCQLSYSFKNLLMFSLKQKDFEGYLDQYFNHRFKKVVKELEKVLSEKYPKSKINYNYADHAKLSDIVEILKKGDSK